MGGAQTYAMIGVGAGTAGGMMAQPVPGTPSSWIAFVGVDDIRASTEKARSLGAMVMHEPSEVPGHGWFAVITDPTGATLAFWQQKA
ncbi:MAG: hypothetical protein J2P47_12195 [Acetobacteraceae bacterium]|nr:hypothetical protein [Acetobacteraceae bacterium]